MHDWTQPKVNTKRIGEQHYGVYINGEMAGTIAKQAIDPTNKKLYRWKHSWSETRFPTKKAAAQDLTEGWVG